VLAARLSDAKFFWEQDQKIGLDVHAEKLCGIVFHEKLGTVADKVERVAKLAKWLCEEGIIRSSPTGWGGGSREAADGGVLADTNPSAPSSLRNAAPPPLQEGEDLATLAERAARLCKADLVTGMVGEFPELQGVMGGYNAAAQGEHPAVSAAIRDHYKPVGQGDDVPTDPVTVAVSLADKLNDLVTYFSAGEIPTGSKDPFALRRACLGALRLLHGNGLRLPLQEAIRIAQRELPRTFLNGVSTFYEIDPLEFSDQYDPKDVSAPWGARFAEAKGKVLVTDAHIIEGGWTRPSKLKVLYEIPAPYWQRLKLLDFFADRLKVQQREAGVRHDLIDAVFALGGEDDLVRLLARVKALQAFVGTAEGANLLAAYKRAANILKANPSPLEGEGRLAAGERGEGSSAAVPAPSPALAAPAFPSPSRGEGVEAALQSALDTAELLASAAIAAEDFEAAMAALASLRAPIDAFFEGVMVNDPDPAIRAARQALLARFRDAVHKVADFSKIEG
jgi:glycyl-tRNA synthetase beta chain